MGIRNIETEQLKKKRPCASSGGERRGCGGELNFNKNLIRNCHVKRW